MDIDPEKIQPVEKEFDGKKVEIPIHNTRPQ
jgi:hypothetical protein